MPLDYSSPWTQSALAGTQVFDPALQMQKTEVLMPREDILPLSGYDQTMPLPLADETLEQTLLQDERDDPNYPWSDWSVRLAEAYGNITGAPLLDEAAPLSQYMAAVKADVPGIPEDWRWQALEDQPSAKVGYGVAHPFGYDVNLDLNWNPFEPQTTPGGDEVSAYGQPGGPGAPWTDELAGSFPQMPTTRTDPYTSREYTPGIPSHTTILKTWWCGPRGGPRIRFVMFMHNGRKMIGCNRKDGSWKQWPVYKPLVIGKKMDDRKARRVAKHMERYVKGVKKVVRVLGYKITR